MIENKNVQATKYTYDIICKRIDIEHPNVFNIEKNIIKLKNKPTVN